MLHLNTIPIILCLWNSNVELQKSFTNFQYSSSWFGKIYIFETLTSAFQYSSLFSCKLVTNFIQLYDYILQFIEPFSQRIILQILSLGLVFTHLSKKDDIQSKVGSRNSLYSFMHNSFFFLQKCSFGEQNAKQKLSTLYQ